MVPLRIRQATLADLGALQRIYRASVLSNDGDRALMLSHPEVLVFAPDAIREGRTRVATEPGGTILGFASTTTATEAVTEVPATAPAATAATAGQRRTRTLLELEDLFVDPPSMRLGVGTRLIEDVVGLARTTGADGIEVTANPHAMAFYESVGFVPAGVAQTRFGPAPRMRLDIR
jgi:GNAT superfamily N-acetyltransferase